MTGLAEAPSTPLTGPHLDGRRVAAAAVDVLLLAPVALAIVTLCGGISPTALLLSSAWALYYFFAFESGSGQTVGKRLLGLRVLHKDGRDPVMGEIAVRTVLRMVDGAVGLVVMLATGERRQRLGDIAAGTVVASATASPAARAAEVEDAVSAFEPEEELLEEPPPSPPLDIGSPLPFSEADAPPVVAEVKPFDPFVGPPAEQDEEPELVAPPVPPPLATPEDLELPDPPVVAAAPEPELSSVFDDGPLPGIDDAPQVEIGTPPPPPVAEPLPPLDDELPEIEIVSSRPLLSLDDADEPRIEIASDQPFVDQPVPVVPVEDDEPLVGGAQADRRSDEHRTSPTIEIVSRGPVFADEPVPVDEPADDQGPRLVLPPPASASDLLFGAEDEQGPPDQAA